jgi:hypothetical protein
MTKTEIALYLSAIGVIAPHLSPWVIVALLLWMLVNSSHDGDAA